MEDRTLIVVISAIFTALVFVFTVLFVLATPATRGYWNVGEVGVFLAAFIGGPIIGAIAGGLGSALADIFLGYAYYAPGTLVIKGTEGFVAGYLFWKMKELVNSKEKRVYLMVIIALMFAIIFVSYLLVFTSVGKSEIVVELISEPLNFVISASIPIWGFLSFILVLELLAIAFMFIGREELLIVFAGLVAGTIMVFGYFLYETALFGSSVALIEVIPNYFQAIVGILVSVPVIRRLERLGVLDKYRKALG